jgi:hypothetical protein
MEDCQTSPEASLLEKTNSLFPSASKVCTSHSWKNNACPPPISFSDKDHHVIVTLANLRYEPLAVELVSLLRTNGQYNGRIYSYGESILLMAGTVVILVDRNSESTMQRLRKDSLEDNVLVVEAPTLLPEG